MSHVQWRRDSLPDTRHEPRPRVAKHVDAPNQAIQQKKAARTSSGNTCFYAEKEIVAALVRDAADIDDANFDVFEEKLSSMSPAVVIID